jgi:glycerophosphoryl diester phosphodiesterase
MIKFYWRINRNRFRLWLSKFIQAKSIHPHFHLHKRKHAQMQEKGLLFPWTINELEDIQKIKHST